MSEKKPKKGNVLKIVIIILLLLIVVGGAAFGGMYLAGRKGSTTTPTQAKVAEVKEVTYSLDESLVNLMDEDGKRYLKVSVYIGYGENDKLTTELTTKKPIIRDVLIEILRSKRTTDFSTVKGVDAIKSELIARINPVLSTGKISHIYFNDLLVQ